MNVSFLLFGGALIFAAAAIVTSMRLGPFSTHDEANFRIGFYAVLSWTLLLSSNILSLIGF